MPRFLLRRLVCSALIGLFMAAPAAAADFGSAPSGEVPILFNDHTVYAKPDLLTANRVLAALVKDGQLYVPLRSMFEAMGAVVAASPDGRTVTAMKSGASVAVTVGRAEVVVNGESRPLDVPPVLEHGVVLVPVRVLSEAMGAYVQWLPSRHVVVVRYLEAPVSAPPTAAPTAAPAAVPAVVPVPAPMPTPSPAPVFRTYTVFVQGAYSYSRNYSEFEAGKYCDTFLLNAAYAPLHSPFAVKADYRQDTDVTSSNRTDALGNQYTQFATIDGGTAFTPVFKALQSSLDVRLEYRIASPRVYVGVGYLHTSNNYGYPQLNAVGAGVEKLPDLRAGLSFYGSAFYYPSATGNYTIPAGTSANAGLTYQQQYRIFKYDLGLALVVAHSPVYLYGGFSGDQYAAAQHAPIGQIHDGPYIGLGVKL